MAKKGCGCVVTAVVCVTVLTLALLAAVVWFASSTFSILPDAPKPLDVPEISEETERRLAVIDESMTAFYERDEPFSFGIGNDLVNPWLRMNRNPDLRFLGDHAWITLAGERLECEVAAPLAPIGIQGRYFNGRLTLSGWTRPSDIRLFLHSVSIDGVAGERLNLITKVLEGRDFAETLDLSHAIDQKFLSRCTLELKSSQLRIECK